jgi:Eukaryotic aspartyl protease
MAGKLFGLHLQRAENTIGDMGEISFGVANPDRFTGQLVWAPNLNTALWEIAIVRL